MNSNTFRKVISKKKTWFTAIIFTIFPFMVMLPAHGWISAAVRIQILKTDVINLNLDQGISTSLQAKLDAALEILKSQQKVRIIYRLWSIREFVWGYIHYKQL